MEYDIIGDIHGHAGALERLLGELGYSRRGGTWRHPSEDRHTLFLGDIIDRGPDQLEAIDTVRRMIDGGRATCLLGNHEHSAMGWMLRDPRDPEAFMRPHNAKNLSQHRVFLEQLGGDRAVASDLFGWMASLPVYADLPGIRGVHACWQPGVIGELAAITGGTGLLSGEALYESYRKGSPTRELVDVTIRGREVPLPEGVTFVDGDGVTRDKSRIRWWNDFVPDRLRDLIVDEIDFEDEDELDASGLFLNAGDTDPRPVFFGHYWMAGAPRLLGAKATCLDFSVAAGGSLAAYTWRGEPQLVEEHLTSVPALEVDNLVKFA
jgi:hypothetical protein